MWAHDNTKDVTVSGEWDGKTNYRPGNQLLRPQSLVLQSPVIDDDLHTSVDTCTLIINLIQTYSLNFKISLRHNLIG